MSVNDNIVIRFVRKIGRTPLGGAALVVAAVLVPFVLDSACGWDLRHTHLFGGGGFAIFSAALINAFFLAGLFLIFGRAVKCLCYPLFWIVAIVGSLEIFARMFFGFTFEGDWILILLESSPSEVCYFVKQYMDFSVGVFSLGVILICVASTCVLKCVIVGRRGVLCYLFGLILVTPVVICEVNADSWGRCFGNVKTKRVIADTMCKVLMYIDLFSISQSPDLGGSNLSLDADDIMGLVVIGESATRNSMSLYGYGRKTTPCLDCLADELYVFSDVLAPWGNTPMACRYILTEATLSNPNQAYCTIAQVFKRAGARCAVVSNQTRWGAYGHVCGYLFEDCQASFYLPEIRASYHYDSEALPYIESAFVSNRLVFVHLAGSHFPPESTYPKEAAVFAGDDKINQYDNSIHYTDSVLGDMIESLKKNGAPSFMLYLSDHGETPRAETWRDVGDRDLWEIPMVVWLSDEYKERYPETARMLDRVKNMPIQTDRIFGLILALAQVRGFTGHCHDDDILAPDFIGHQDRKIGLGR